MKCSKCGEDIAAGGGFNHQGETLCEDCYITARQNLQVCDPIAVRSATRIREKKGITGTDGLTDMQKAVHDFIKSRGEVTREEIMERLSLTRRETENHFAVLRHCELVRGFKRGDDYYITLFNAE